MNAVDQAVTPEMASKIACLGSLFRQEFLDASPDLSPWLSDEVTQSFLDPYSIDVSFHFPGWHPTCRGHCVLAQLRYDDSPHRPNVELIGIDAIGYCHTQPQWKISTVGEWVFEGTNLPSDSAQEKIKNFFRGVFHLFQQPIPNQRNTS